MDAAACWDENGVAKIVDDAAHLCYPDVHNTAAQTRNGDLYIFISSVEPAAAAYCKSDAVAGEALALVSQEFGDKTASVHGAFAERLRRVLPILGLSVTCLAVTGLATGEPTPAAGFGLFLMLVAGLSTVTIRALRS